MGYNTDFGGSFTLTPALSEAQQTYLIDFSESKRMKRSAAKCSGIADPVREAVGLPVGVEGEYCVFNANDGSYGQSVDASVIDSDIAASTQPSYPWCGWEPAENGSKLKWGEMEKAYDYLEWLKYINESFLKPWGVVIDGKVHWSGDDIEDNGTIFAKQGVIFTTDDL